MKAPPYIYTYTVPSSTSYGTHTVKAVAYDAAGTTAVAKAKVTRVR